ncbi:error-prone DNA polymerase [Pseudomarimonas arenosa]|uniref:Error-prone DNA polymerase n=1 Tax=Pseudomarimonas arenosa TaxID=2774145 RepID=A0AAW3ZMD1_9GAMM|nr:error-prone DNA polymerase [Pseudomarimonas arenosa]MBD8526329.1 error-prone DNA polymerase [Pseudomarimonas arenosa]
MKPLPYSELHCLSNFSFGRGASSADELFARAKALGYRHLAITDECSLAGIVRALEASEKHGVPLIVGSELNFDDGLKLVLLCENQAGYARLCELITTARRAAEKGEYRLSRDMLSHVGTQGLCCLWLAPALNDTTTLDRSRCKPLSPPRERSMRTDFRAPAGAPELPPRCSGRAGVGLGSRSLPAQGPRIARFLGRGWGEGEAQHISPSPLPGERGAKRKLGEPKGYKADSWITSKSPMPPHTAGDAFWLKRHFADRLWIAVELHCDGQDSTKLQTLQTLGKQYDIPLVASGDVHMHVRRRRALQDALTAIRLNCRVDAVGLALFPNGERHLRAIDALAELYSPALLEETQRIASRCQFSLRKLRYDYPHELVPEGETPTSWLRQLTERGARWRWPQGVPEESRALIAKELALIAELRYEAFFLTVHDVVDWARRQGILCQGRGSAANSVVCYCLGITSVGPERIGMLFERFVSKERDEPPDIDVDFEHQRREEVIQYIYRKYGRERAALAATVICYRSKSAARDLGRVLGFSEDQLEQLSRVFARGNSRVERNDLLREYGFDPDSPELRRFLILFNELRGFPRHLSQHVGGFVIAEQPLWQLVPVENAAMPDRTIIQWDKDDLESLGLLKVDCLALGMLSCLRRCLDLLRQHHNIDLNLAQVPEGDAATYTMIQRGDTLGVFQIESRAQMAMLPRLRPANFYDLVIEVAIVRPGPIQGDMVHPYLRRRCGEEPVHYASPILETVLGRTLGVPIFQEQVMHLAIVAAGFSPGEADQLRRSMAAWKRHGGLEQWYERVVGGMLERGYPREFAERIFEQIKGFGSYGFPESHAASFALLAYVSSWLKCHHPAAYACALLNSQPMGFYSPAQIVQDARRHGVEVRPVDVLVSGWDSTLEKDSRRAGPGPPLLHSELAAVSSPYPGTSLCEAPGQAKIGSLTPPRPSPNIGEGVPGHQPARENQCASISPHPLPHQGGGAIKPVSAKAPASPAPPPAALRLGLQLIRGLSQDCAERIVAARWLRPFADVQDLVDRAQLSRDEKEKLAAAGALKRLAGHRHRAFWAIAGSERHTDLLAGTRVDETQVRLPLPSRAADTFADYRSTGLTLADHPLKLIRSQLRTRRMRQAIELPAIRDGAPVRVAGLVTMRQRPATATGVTFVTLEDETGLVNLVVWRTVADRQRRPLLEARLLGVDGVLQKKDEVIHVIAGRLHDLSAMLDGLDTRSRDFH